MSFEEFQNCARLYVIGALEPEELQDFEAARKQYGSAAEDFINNATVCTKLLPSASSRPRPPTRSRSG